MGERPGCGNIVVESTFTTRTPFSTNQAIKSVRRTTLLRLKCIRNKKQLRSKSWRMGRPPFQKATSGNAVFIFSSRLYHLYLAFQNVITNGPASFWPNSRPAPLFFSLQHPSPRPFLDVSTKTGRGDEGDEKRDIFALWSFI